MPTAATTQQHLVVLYIMYHHLFFTPSLAPFYFSALVVLLPAEKSIIIILSVYAYSCRRSIGDCCTYVRVLSCFYFFRSFVVFEIPAARKLPLYINVCVCVSACSGLSFCAYSCIGGNSGSVKDRPVSRLAARGLPSQGGVSNFWYLRLWQNSLGFNI